MTSVLALFSATVYGVADFLGGRATAGDSVRRVMFASQASGTVAALLLTGVIASEWSVGAFLWGAVGGVTELGAFMLLYRALATGPNRIVSPVTGVVIAAVSVVVGLATGEHPSGRATAGLVLTPIAVWLIADGALDREQDKRPLAYAILGGVGFGVFLACLDQAPVESGAVPLVAARAVPAALLFCGALLHPIAQPLDKQAVLFGAIIGFLDMAGNAMFVWAVHRGDLAITGALVSLFPATTIVLAVIFLGERLRTRQLVGVGLALLAAALLS